MSFRLVGKTGPEVLAHRHEALLNLCIPRVGRHVPLGYIVTDAHQQAQRLKVMSCPQLSTVEENP